MLCGKAVQLEFQELKGMLVAISDRIIESESLLTEIDSVIGDGDHGMSMKRGFAALKRMLETVRFDSPATLMKASGVELVKSMGGASGVLFGSLFISGIDAFHSSDRVSASELAEFISKGTESVMKRGRARLCDKTMIDALLPAADAMKKRADEGGDMRDVLKVAFEAAVAGADATRTMKPRVGRSKNFADKALDVPDPGAVSVSLLFEAMHEYVEEREE